MSGMEYGSNDTLGKLPGNYFLHFHCSNSPYCRFNKPMDIKALIKRLGHDFDCTRLYEVLKCSKCKGRKFLVICTPVHMSYGNVQ